LVCRDRLLNRRGALNGIDHRAELDPGAVTGDLDDAAAMSGEQGVDDLAAKAPQRAQRPRLVPLDQPRVADHVGAQYGRQTALDTRFHGRAAPTRVVALKPSPRMPQAGSPCIRNGSLANAKSRSPFKAELRSGEATRRSADAPAAGRDRCRGAATPSFPHSRWAWSAPAARWRCRARRGARSRRRRCTA
jgi:hypothetical protein